MNYIFLIAVIILFLLASMRIVKPKHLGLVERLGKFHKLVKPGYHLIRPLIDQLKSVNVAEQVVVITPKSFITRDKREAQLEVKAYYHIKTNIPNLIKDIYEINDNSQKINDFLSVSLKRIIGDMSNASIRNYMRKINVTLYSSLVSDVKNLGILIDRVEVNQIEPGIDPKKVLFYPVGYKINSKITPARVETFSIYNRVNTGKSLN